MCENKVTTKCYRVKLWQRRWAFSGKAFGMRMCFKEEPEDNLVEKESAKKNSVAPTTKMASPQPRLHT